MKIALFRTSHGDELSAYRFERNWDMVMSEDACMTGIPLIRTSEWVEVTFPPLPDPLPDHVAEALVRDLDKGIGECIKRRDELINRMGAKS